MPDELMDEGGVDRAQMFLDSFANIETHLKQFSRADKSKPFSALVNQLSDNNRLVRHYSSYLLDFGDLRNAIVHAPRYEGRPVADPRKDIVWKIREIEDKLLRPPDVSVAGFIHDVYSVTPAHILALVLKDLAQRDYSQAPVIHDGRIIGLISGEGIAHWLGKLAVRDETIVCTDDVQVSDVMGVLGHPKNYKVVPRRTNLVEAREYFVDAIGLTVPLEALLITENGKDTESVIGIVTRSEDLSVIMRYI